jgi:hypothetical protein
MSNLCNSHSIQLSNIEIYILSLILEHIDFELELELKGGTKVSLSDIKEKISQKLKEVQELKEVEDNE